MNNPIFTLDTTVFFFDDDAREIHSGVITGINKSPDGKIRITVEHIVSADRPNCKASYAQAFIPSTKCFASLDECRAAITAAIEDEKDKYRKEINSVEDLLMFVCKHDISGESYAIEIDEPDKLDHIVRRREVFVEKAMALLNITLPAALPIKY